LARLTRFSVQDYAKFWNNFGKYIKVGVIEDEANKDELAELTRFYSTKSEDDVTSLAQYVSRIKPADVEGSAGSEDRCASEASEPCDRRARRD
jgi:heat shock protein beta|tara:strand:+ start:339 stop:617 length:279 start_codon:yes stop_codon:yes gene_type:complete